MQKNYYLLKKGKKNGFLNIREAAKFKNVPISKIETNITCFNHAGSILKIKFDKKFLNW